MPTLYIHDRTRMGTPITEIETDALIACFGRVAEATEELEHRAGRFLAWLRDERLWLACQCKPEMPAPLPLMAPRQRDGVLHIFRLPTSLPHHPDCPFHRDASESAGEMGSPRQLAPMRPLDTGWLVLRDSAPRTHADAVPSRDATSGPGGLNRVLFSILDSLGYARLAADAVRAVRDRPPTWAGTNPYTHLERLDSLDLADGVRFDSVGTTFLPSVPTLLRNLPAKVGLFEGRRPQGLFVGQIQDIEREGNQAALLWRGTLQFAERCIRVPVHGTVRRFGAGRLSHGPYWCAAALGQRPGEDDFRVLDAYVHPVFSKALLLPVDSDAERETARILIDQVAFWHRSDRIASSVVLSKPLFAECAPDGHWLRPDFSLHLPNGTRILVETMQGDSAYLVDKAAQHDAMRCLPNVVALMTHTPGGDDAGFRRALTHLVMQERHSKAV